MEFMQDMIEQKISVDMLLTDIPYNSVNRKDNGLRKLDKENADILTFDIQHYLELADTIVVGNFIIFCGKEQISQIYK